MCIPRLSFFPHLSLWMIQITPDSYIMLDFLISPSYIWGLAAKFLNWAHNWVWCYQLWLKWLTFYLWHFIWDAPFIHAVQIIITWCYSFQVMNVHTKSQILDSADRGKADFQLHGSGSHVKWREKRQPMTALKLKILRSLTQGSIKHYGKILSSVLRAGFQFCQILTNIL